MQNLLDPAILFFVFGIFAGLIRSNLTIPEPLTKFLSLYLLMGIGLKGGFALSKSGLNQEIVITLCIAIFLAVLIPIIGYNLLKKKLGRYDAAAIAATYGSVSAVTFITASQFLDIQSITYGGHMAAAMVLMESPAIIIAIYFGNRASMYDKAKEKKTPTRVLVKDSLKDGAQLLLIGAMVIGFLTALLFRLNFKQALTISLESGNQNGTLAIEVGSLINNKLGFGFPAAVYSLFMYFTAAVPVFIGIKKSNKKLIQKIKQKS